MLAGLECRARGGFTSSSEESLEELAELAWTAGAAVRARVLQSRPAPDAATLLGSGKAQELAAEVAAHDASLLIIDNELSPVQQRNLEKLVGARVIDRTQLILDIFASRARTREGRLQVELAQLTYLMPRLSGRGVEMSRLGGGIGTRGPGETQLETDRRRIARRIRKIDEELESVRTSRGVHRSQRSSVPLPVIALAGYTNAGKSTLFNALTAAGVYADDRLFATLDPTVRGLRLPTGRRVLLGDTVGFIRSLPVTLVRAFRATLEEVKDATLVLHVVDASSPAACEQAAHVGEVLREIGAGETPVLLVLNKIDLVEAEDVAYLRQRLLGEGLGETAAVSALNRAGLDSLLDAIDRVLPFDPVRRRRFRIPAGDGESLHLLHEYGRVVAKRYEGECCEIEADVAHSLETRLARFVLEEAS